MDHGIKSVSAARPHWRKRQEKQRGGENVIWKRLTWSFDAALRKHGADPSMCGPVTRWVLFGHLTVTEGMAGRWYGDVMRKFDRYHVDTASRTARAQRYERASPGEDQEIARREADGSIDNYERQAKKARRNYDRLQVFLRRFPGAKEALDSLCVLDIEPPAGQRESIAAILSLLAKEFGIANRTGIRIKGGAVVSRETGDE